METLSFGDPVDLWESQDDHGRSHIGYGICLNPSILFIYGAQGLEECIIVSLEIVFLLYQEWTFFSLTPTLWNFGLVVRKSSFWLISQVITRLEHIGNETIKNIYYKEGGLSECDLKFWHI
jgi:hypothetical protein